jgi:hypothetical protein
MSVTVDPTLLKVEIIHWHNICVSSMASITQCIDIPQHMSGATLFSLHASSSGRTKFELILVDCWGSNEKMLATLFSSPNNPSLQFELGNVVQPGTRVMVRATNHDVMPCDSYVTLRYSLEDAYDIFSRKFHRDLEAELERTS